MKSFRAIALFALMGASAVALAEGPGVQGEIEQSSATTAEEKSAYATKSMDEINAALATVEKLLETAKKANQREAVECLEAKRTELKKSSEIGRMSATAMQAALSENDNVHADAEFRKLAVALTKSKEFLADAQQCVSSPDAKKGTTVVGLASKQDSLIDVDDQDEGVLIEPPVSPN